MLNYYNTQVTVELGELIDSGVKLWDFDYPVPRSIVEYNGKTCKVDFDKATFEQKVIDHYRFRQIGQETPGRFLHYFRTRIREIMPYYVQLYEFDAKFRNIEDPLESYNLVETFQQATKDTGRSTSNTSGSSESSNTVETTGSSESSNTVETSGTTNNLTKFSDTPQGTVGNMETHLTNATKIDGTDTSNTTGTATTNTTGSNTTTGSESTTDTTTGTTEGTGEVTHTLTRKGNIGVQPLGGEVENIRSAFINIDMQIIDELRDLFLQVY